MTTKTESELRELEKVPCEPCKGIGSVAIGTPYVRPCCDCGGYGYTYRNRRL